MTKNTFRIGLAIAITVAMGLGLAIGVLATHQHYCSPLELYPACEIIRKNPPWLLLSGLAAAPSVLLTWYWRTSQKEADIAQKERDIEQKTSDLRHRETDIGIARQRMFNERFSTAINLLGNEKLDVRVGAVYALEALSKDSPDHYGTVVEVLAAFVRTHAAMPKVDTEEEDNGEEDARLYVDVSSDVQSAITVLGRRAEAATDGYAIDLTRCVLNKLNMQDATLIGVNLTGSMLRYAKATRACLGGADLSGTDLTEACFDSSYLDSVKMNNSDCARASFLGAVLSRAEIRQTMLTDANLSHAALQDSLIEYSSVRDSIAICCHLERTTLKEVDLRKTDLTGSDLSRTKLLGCQLDGAIFWPASTLWAVSDDCYFSEETKFPADLSPFFKRMQMRPVPPKATLLGLSGLKLDPGED